MPTSFDGLDIEWSLRQIGLNIAFGLTLLLLLVIWGAYWYRRTFLLTDPHEVEQRILDCTPRHVYTSAEMIYECVHLHLGVKRIPEWFFTATLSELVEFRLLSVVEGPIDHDDPKPELFYRRSDEI